MGVLNRIMLILILLAAAGAAVLSYFLFEKRTEMLKGWKLMADQIDVTAKKIDQGSGTKVAADIKSGEFSHRDLTAMETRLKKLSAAADSLIKQRNGLVDTIHTIAKDAANQEVDKNAFLNIATYEAAKKDVEGKVKQAATAEKNLLNGIITDYANLGRSIGKGMSTEDIKKSNKRKELNRYVADTINKQKKAIAESDAGYKELVKKIKVSHSSGKFEDTTKDIAKEIASLVEKEKAAHAARVRAENQVKAKTAQIASLNKTIAQLKNDKNTQEKEISRLKLKINPTNDPNVNKLEYGTRTEKDYELLYKTIRKEVKKVDTKWNFVIVDLGAKTLVQQTFAGRTYKTVLDITPGKTMTIVRNIKSNNPEVIAKIELTEVHADYSVANIKMDTLKSAIREGDVVIFNSDDLKLIQMDIQKLLMGKK